MESVDKIYKLLKSIEETNENKNHIIEIKRLLSEQKYIEALDKMRELKEIENNKEDYVEIEEDENTNQYPKEISNKPLERVFVGLLLDNPRRISKYYFVYENCMFEDPEMLNIYKSVLFNEGSRYSSEKAKDGFNFAKDSEEVFDLKSEIKKEVRNQNYNIENVYTELRKLFIIRKAYLEEPEKNIQDRIIEITKYDLYKKMSGDEVEDTVEQIKATQKFKQSVLSNELSKFLESGEGELANGLSYPFPIITQVFKGIRKGETLAYAMPSNYGKSRFTIDIAAYTSLIHKKKVLIISNEMSEEKMKLCLITTIINNPDIKKLHGQDVEITEGELLKFSEVKDKKKREKVIKAVNWASKQIDNQIYFINITDHTNDELKKVIVNFYYKKHIEYVFYDTLKTDTENIGKPEEIKKTATILSNLAQNFNIFIGSSLQLTESKTSPLNLDVNDLAVSRTVKEVLDTLCLFKQIPREDLGDYEYSLKEVDTEFFDLEKSKNPDIRYYACVIDKNRAGAKPKLVFRINLAYNSWVELGFLKLKGI